MTQLEASAPTSTSPRGAKYKFWTTVEDRVLREGYEAKGPLALMPELPSRSLSAIIARAHFLRLSQPGPRGGWGRGRPLKYPSDPKVDEAIRALYTQTPRRSAVADLANRLSRPGWWVTARARKLGCLPLRFKEPEWAEAELEILEANAWRTPEAMARSLRKAGFTRSPTACAVRARRGHFERLPPATYTANGLSRLMGVNPTTVGDWIKKHGLPAKRRGTERTATQGGDMWLIHTKQLRQWIATHQQLVDLRKVDRYWFIDLAFGRT